MSPSTSQSLPTGKDPPENTNTSSPIASPQLPYATMQPSQPQKPQEASTIARPIFSPFFTLIDDATSSSTHHPVNVRYVFSDDDQDLTDAYLAAMSAAPSSQSSSDITTHSESSSITSSREQTSKQQRSSGRDPREPEHRTLLVDLDETGTSIKAAHSLSSSWQILSASLTKAPTWESSPTAEEDAVPARFMLRIEGTQGKDEKKREKAAGKSNEGVRPEDFQALMEDFDRKMRVLRTVVDAGNETLGLEQPEDSHDDDGEGEKDEPRG
jgi:hypothetical protein